jgi:hypothetical protein
MGEFFKITLYIKFLDLLKNRYFCKFCTNAYFNSFEKFQNHMKIHKNEGKKCNHCETSFVSNRAMAIHSRFVHGNF